MLHRFAMLLLLNVSTGWVQLLAILDPVSNEWL